MASTDIIYSWQDIENIIASMAEHIEETGKKFQCVIGVARGGVIPAILLAGALGVRNVSTIQCVKYEGRKNLGIQYRESFPRLYPGVSCLVVDDIVGTGETLMGIESERKSRRGDLDVSYASVVARTDRLVSPDLFCIGRILAGDGWVVFPWETNRKTEG